MAKKILGQSNPAATTLTDMYTVPGGTTAVVSTLSICNRSGSETAKVRVEVSPAGAASAASHSLIHQAEVTATDSLFLTIGITLGATDVLRVYSTTANVTFQAFGDES